MNLGPISTTAMYMKNNNITGTGLCIRNHVSTRGSTTSHSRIIRHNESMGIIIYNLI